MQNPWVMLLPMAVFALAILVLTVLGAVLVWRRRPMPQLVLLVVAPFVAGFVGVVVAMVAAFAQATSPQDLADGIARSLVLLVLGAIGSIALAVVAAMRGTRRPAEHGFEVRLSAERAER